MRRGMVVSNRCINGTKLTSDIIRLKLKMESESLKRSQKGETKMSLISVAKIRDGVNLKPNS
jgi:hypothetical protein